jgi:sugar fermentation stimulation protein A
MELPWDFEGTFILRPNRFTGIVDMDGEKEIVHVHDPGRLEELLYTGNKVLIKRAEGRGRKTKWDLIAARYENQWVFTNSGYHRKISEDIVKAIFPHAEIKAEVKVGHSRLDFVVIEKGNRTGIEVKGCTLTENGRALFPDAPTERGRRHIETLMEMMRNGHRAMLLVLVFRKDSECFAPNERTDPKFAEVFRRALSEGLEVRPMLIEYDGKSLWWAGEIGLCEA